MESIYMDHAAATPVKKPVMEAMLPYFEEKYANPSTLYGMGLEIHEVMEEQRAKVATLINTKPERIIFTSSGAEANNLAVKGVAFARKKKGNHIIVSSIEHHSVLNTARFFERLDFEVTLLPVDQYGLVDPDRLLKAIRPETILVSIMHANNEIGTIEPISNLADVCRGNSVLFHTDAVASVGNIPVDVNELGVDLLSLSGIPLGAPKGTGALYFGEKVRIMPLIHGGIQENGRRAGTENVPAIVGLGKAAEIAAETLPRKTAYIKALRDHIIAGIQSKITEVTPTGHPEKRLPGHASFCIKAIEGEALLFLLNDDGICVNTGSACASKALKTSPVLVAINVPAELAQGSIVFTLDETNTKEQVDYMLEKLSSAVERLRTLSPLWRKQAAG